MDEYNHKKFRRFREEERLDTIFDLTPSNSQTSSTCSFSLFEESIGDSIDASNFIKHEVDNYIKVKGKKINGYSNKDVKKNIKNEARDGMTGKRHRIPRCARCLNHEKVNPVKGHKRHCQFRNCDCELCLFTQNRQNVMAIHVKKNRDFAQDVQLGKIKPRVVIPNEICDETGDRKPKCARCKNHDVLVPVKGHKRVCPWKDCDCAQCRFTEQRQRVMAKHIKNSREMEEDLKRNNLDSPIGDYNSMINIRDISEGVVKRTMSSSSSGYLSSSSSMMSPSDIGNLKEVAINWNETNSNPDRMSKMSPEEVVRDALCFDRVFDGPMTDTGRELTPSIAYSPSSSGVLPLSMSSISHSLEPPLNGLAYSPNMGTYLDAIHRLFWAYPQSFDVQRATWRTLAK